MEFAQNSALERLVLRRTTALRRTEENLTDFFNRAPLGLFWVGPDGRVQQVNRAGLDLLGCRKAECLKHPIARYLDPEQVAEALHLLAQRQTLHNFRARFRRRDGTSGHILVDANGLWSNSRLVFSRWFVRDISRRVELEREILRISEQEKRRIGQDLHDDLCQRLAGVEFLSQTLARHLARRSDACAARAREIARMAREAMNHTRELAHGLSPVRLESDGLRQALIELAQRSSALFKVPCRFQCPEIVSIRQHSMSIHLFRIAQEAVTNAVKHGRPKSIDITLTKNAGRIRLTVSDDGKGIPSKLSPTTAKGIGLRLMQYRAGVLGGSLTVRRNPRGGTIVTCSVHENAARLLQDFQT